MKIVMFVVKDGTGTGDAHVEGKFFAKQGDNIVLMGSPHHAVHIWKETGKSGSHDWVDSCNALGSPCPMQAMTGCHIPDNKFLNGTYVVAVNKPLHGGGTSNGQLNVGSGPGSGDGD